MESLLMSGDNGGGMDLNIVVEKPTALATNKPRKPKKRNKYEKRREKARRAREAAEQNETNTNTNEKEETTELVPSLLNDAAQNGIVRGRDTHVDDDKTTSEIVPTSDTLSTSRRRHDGKSLDTVQNRAKYMAEFHARPLEMDRRSGAVSTFARSKDSQHIFDDACNNESDSTTTPWSHLKLQPRVESTLVGHFKLSKGPTVVQSRSITSLTHQSRHNLFVQSETGSGKTLAYLVPILQSLAVDSQSGQVKRIDRSKGGTRCIILCPTRELASQTASVAEQLCRYSYSWIVSGCLSGGERRKSEKARIRKGITILIATPGRLLDHLGKTESLLMALKGKLEWLVLDEADRLLDMGLGSQVEQVVQHVRANQPKSGINKDGVTWRSVLVSATVTKSVQDLAQTMLGGDEWKWARGVKDDRVVKAISDAQDEAQEENELTLEDSTPRQLKQLHMTVNAKLRLAALVAFLVQRVKNKERTVVFFSTCDSVDYHHALFEKTDSLLDVAEDDADSDNPVGLFGKACQVHKIHGSVRHSQRQQILSNFASAPTAAVLLATDVAARGLNLPGVDWIVQYDAPSEVADYIHRAGRAARAGRAGHSLLFLLPSERAFLNVLEAKGLKDMTALSLASTLNGAADICKDTCELGGNSKNQSRLGEAFGTFVQRRLEDVLAEDDARHQEEQKALLAKKKKRTAAKPKKSSGPLLEMATKAYFSFVRAYPTKEKVIRHIFSARAIHLGHIARSFALKEPPKSLAVRDKQSGKSKDDDSQNLKRNASLAFQETSDTNKKAKMTTSEANRKELPSSTMDDRMNPKRARSMLLARAAQLQGGGMDAF